MTLTDNQHKALAQLVKTSRLLTSHCIMFDALQCQITHQRAPFTVVTGDALKRAMDALVECGLAEEMKNAYKLTEAGLDTYAIGPWNPGTRRRDF